MLRGHLHCATICKRGGFIVQCHDELRDLEAELLRMVCNGVEMMLKSNQIMFEKRLLISAHHAYHHLLPCPMNRRFEKYVSSYDFRRKMTFKLPRPKTDMVKKSCSYKSITRWNALENQMRSIQDVDAFKKSLKCIFKPRIL